MKKNYGITDFSYLSTEYLENLNIKSGSLISTNTECGKIVNNFLCYIACTINSEKSMTAKIDDKVKLRIVNGDEIPAVIKYIVEEDNKRVIVFEIDEDIDTLMEYRKIDFDIIWWNYSGLKVSNSTLSEQNDICYVEQNKGGNIFKIYVKVLRQNETYSIIENYTDEELLNLGFDYDYVESRYKISKYDEILLH